MKKKSNPLKGLISYPLLGLIYLVSVLPMPVLYVLSDFFYLLIYKVFSYRVKVTRNNLQKALPELSKEQLLEVESRFYHHLCDVIVETVKSFTISPKELSKRMKLINPELLLQHYNNGRSMIAVTGHYGNWEWAAITLPLQSPFTPQGVYLAIKDPVMNRAMIRSRSRFGIDLLEAGKMYQEMESRKDRLSITGFVADQSPSRPEKGIWLEFLHQETVVAMGTEKYATQYEMAVAFGKISKVKRGYYTLEYIPVTENAAMEAAGEVTRKHTAILEGIIRQQPEFWLWSHKRWKHKRPSDKAIHTAP
jgi:KDO2-lipid IV(A) lauroyltransferase